MDPARIRSADSKDADGSTVSACEIGHSQAGRSSADDANACNSLLEGAKPSSTDDFICQWTCDEGDITFSTSSKSSFKCKTDSEDTFDIRLLGGSKKSDCLQACAAGGCNSDCDTKCDFLASEAMNAGQAVCQTQAGTVTSSINEVEETEMAATEIVGLIGWIILCCCCQCLAAMSSKKRRDDDAAIPAGVVPT